MGIVQPGICAQRYKKCAVFHSRYLCVICTIGDVLLKPIIAHAGKDISHWFNKDTHDVSEETICKLFVLYSIQYHS